MSIETQIRDPVALNAACQRLQLPLPVLGTTRVFTSEVTGWQVSLRDWRYPVVCDVERGQLHYDHFGGRWGEEVELHKLVQAYAVEKTKLEVRRSGHDVFEQALSNGSVRLQVALA